LDKHAAILNIPCCKSNQLSNMVLFQHLFHHNVNCCMVSLTQTISLKATMPHDNSKLILQLIFLLANLPHG